MPTISFQDRAPLQRTRKLADGRLAAVARFSRSGVYRYTGAEMGRPDLATVNVLRDEAEVFDEAAMASFAHKAITLDHPSEAVRADNWRQAARGWTEGKVARDGDYVEIPLILADAEAVAAYESGTATELSAGYSADIVWGDVRAPDGTLCQARQVRIRGNHIALVAKGRAGSQCRISDSAEPPIDYMRGIVDERLGDKAAGWTDAQVRASYQLLKGTGAPPAPAQVPTGDTTMNQAFLSDADRDAMMADVARQRCEHDLSQRYLGDSAIPWDDSMTEAAKERFLRGRAQPVRDARILSDAELARDQALADRAYEKSFQHLNSWRDR